MKRIILILFLVIAFASIAIAQAGKYQIVPEKKGWFGIGSKPAMMLDTDTGRSWIYQDDQWVPVPLMEEPVAKTTEIKQQQEDEIRALKLKQDAEISALKAKQEEEVNSLKAELEEKPKVITTRTVEKPRVVRAYKKKRSAPEPRSTSGEDNGEAPAWLNE